MTSIRLPVLVAILALASGTAEAQGFFERLFGIAPMRPAPPPANYQNVPPPPSDTFPGDEAPRRSAPAAPVQARPVTMRAPSEEAVLGRELKLNGLVGSLRIERAGGSELKARITLPGRKSAQSAEVCTVQLGGQAGVGLASQGRPDGVQRYQIQDPACPLQIDVLDEAVLVKSNGEACVFQASNCQADAAGMWGPEPTQLLAKARDYESARAVADKGVRDDYKVMVQRSRPENVRPIVAEQAAFSSDREMTCRTYAREGSHSFCNARFSEARLLSLGQRLGVTYAANQTPTPSPDARPARRRPDPYALPTTDDDQPANE